MTTSIEVGMYQKPNLTSPQLQAAIDIALAQVLAEEEMRELLIELGLTPDDTESLRIVVKKDPELAPLLVAILLAYGADATVKLGKSGAKKVWKIVEKKLKDNTTDDVLGQEQEPDN